jgi:hypothetical protein
MQHNYQTNHTTTVGIADRLTNLVKSGIVTGYGLGWLIGVSEIKSRFFPKADDETIVAGVTKMTEGYHHPFMTKDMYEKLMSGYTGNSVKEITTAKMGSLAKVWGLDLTRDSDYYMVLDALQANGWKVIGDRDEVDSDPLEFPILIPVTQYEGMGYELKNGDKLYKNATDTYASTTLINYDTKQNTWLGSYGGGSGPIATLAYFIKIWVKPTIKP